MERRIVKNVNWLLLDFKNELHLLNPIKLKVLKVTTSRNETEYLFGLFEKARTKSQIIKSFLSKFPSFSKKWLDKYLDLLLINNVLEYETKKPKELTREYLIDLDRQMNVLSEIGNGKSRYENQLLLKQTRVALLGLGTLANYTTIGLVASGIGSFKCVDFDRVTRRNIGRQPIFGMSDIGKPKVEVIKRFILDRRKDVKVYTIQKKLTNQKDVEEIIKDCDIVIHLCDQPKALIHRIINSACLRLNKPNIYCCSGRIGPFCIPFKTSCYGCLETQIRKSFPLYDSFIDSLSKVASSDIPDMTIAGSLTGILVAKEVVAYVLGIKPQTLNSYFDISPIDLKIRRHALPRQKDCYACSKKNNPKQLIVGITGTLGAGKGTVAKYLVDKKGFAYFSVRDFLSEKIKKEGNIPDRDALVEMGNRLRKKYGSSYIAEELYKKARRSKVNSVIESLRAPGEISSLKAKGNFVLFAVDANPKIRFKRTQIRGSVTDKISFKEFLANEEREMVSKDPNKQNLGKCILMADYKFDNNGSINSLYAKVEKAITEIKNS